MTPQNLRVLSLRLGYISSIAIVLSLLALTDIYHGEADVWQEWMMLRLGFAVIIAFHVVSLVTLRRLRVLPET